MAHWAGSTIHESRVLEKCGGRSERDVATCVPTKVRRRHLCSHLEAGRAARRDGAAGGICFERQSPPSFFFFYLHVVPAASWGEVVAANVWILEAKRGVRLRHEGIGALDAYPRRVCCASF